MTVANPHNCGSITETTQFYCEACGEPEKRCMVCGKVVHQCLANLPSNLPPTQKVEPPADPRIEKGFRVVPGFPDYMVNLKATVKHIPTGKYCFLVRVSPSGGAMINVRRDGKTFTRAAQQIRDLAFPDAKEYLDFRSNVPEAPEAF